MVKEWFRGKHLFYYGMGGLAFIFILLIITKAILRKNNESFGTSPGTMDQLRSTHVTTQEDLLFYQRDYPKMVRREITELTADDPGEIRPWIFPWYGRGIVLVH
jgi:hypothetical protein